jgi:hypothetical protein
MLLEVGHDIMQRMRENIPARQLVASTALYGHLHRIDVPLVMLPARLIRTLKFPPKRRFAHGLHSNFRV